jgi:hypothetical protein
MKTCPRCGAKLLRRGPLRKGSHSVSTFSCGTISGKYGIRKSNYCIANTKEPETINDIDLDEVRQLINTYGKWDRVGLALMPQHLSFALVLNGDVNDKHNIDDMVYMLNALPLALDEIKRLKAQAQENG